MRWLSMLAAATLSACSGSTDQDGTPGDFTLEFCPDDIPLWVALQDGDGAWSRVVPASAGNRFDFSFDHGRGGIAMVHDQGGATLVTVVLGTPDELSKTNDALSCTRKEVSGVIANPVITDVYVVALGPRWNTAWEGSSFAWLLNAVPAGPLPLIAVRDTTPGHDILASSIIRRDGIDIPNGGTLVPALDFQSSQVFSPATAEFTPPAEPEGEAGAAEVFFAGQGSDEAPFTSVSLGPTADPLPYAALPLDRLNADEWQALRVGMGNAEVMRTTTLYFRSTTNRVIALGPYLAAPTISAVVAGQNLLPRLQLPVQPEMDRKLLLAHGARGAVTMSATAAWRGNASTWDISVPDFSHTAGWNTAWGLDPSYDLTWFVEAVGGTVREAGDAFGEGATRLSGAASGILGKTGNW